MHLPLHSRHLSKMHSWGFRTQITLQHLDLFSSPHQRDDWFFCWELFHSQIACVHKVVSESTLGLMALGFVIISIFVLCSTLLYTGWSPTVDLPDGWSRSCPAALQPSAPRLWWGPSACHFPRHQEYHEGVEIRLENRDIWIYWV